jgi:hypothetical protein
MLCYIILLLDFWVLVVVYICAYLCYCVVLKDVGVVLSVQLSAICKGYIIVYEHKVLGINYLLNRLNTYPISKKVKDAEMNTIENILYNNKYNTNLIGKPRPPQKQNTHWPWAPKNKMGHLYVQQQRSKKNH